MGLFGEKISKKEYDDLMAAYKKITGDYEKLVKNFELEKKKLKEKVKLQVQQEKEIKDIKLECKILKGYRNELTVAFRDLLTLEKDFRNVLKEDDDYIYIKREDYQSQYGDEDFAVSTLRIYRGLGIIRTQEKSFTKTKRFGNESSRYIWFNKGKIEIAKKYFQKSM